MSLLQRILKSGAETHYQRGMQAFNQGRHADALRAFESSLEIVQDSSNPVTSLAHFYAAEASMILGCAALEDGRPEHARHCFDRALRHNPHFPDLNVYAAVAACQLGLFESGLQSLRLALDLDGEHLEAHCLLGLVLHKLCDPEAAQRELDWVGTQTSRLRRPLPGFLRDLLDAHVTQVPGLRHVLRWLESASDEATSTPAETPAETQTA